MSARAVQPRQIGRFEIRREIGRGAMGIVYEALDPVIGRMLALKTIALPPGLDDHGRAVCHERFSREARAAGVLSHPGIVTVYEAGKDESSERSYIAMEYVPGRTLQAKLREEGPLSGDEARRIAVRLADALDYAHRKGIVHRDLKPANILLGDDGMPKIADFGVARLESSDLTREGQSLGSPAYMSPEQVLGRETDGRSDLFSVGVLLYEMLAGERPFRGVDLSAIAYQIVHEDPAPPSTRRATVAAAWDGVIARLLAKRPEGRYADAAALRAALEDLSLETPEALETATVVDDHPGLAERGRRWRGRAAALSRHAAAAAEIAGRRAPGLLRSVASAAGHLASGLLRRVDAGLRAVAPSLMTGTRARVLPVAVVGLAIAGVWLMTTLLIGGQNVQVELSHGLQAGRLQVEMDGREVLDRAFTGDRDPVRLFGKEVFSRPAGSLTGSFRASPGEHEFLVRVVDAEGEEEWTERTTHVIPDGGATILSVRIATGFKKNLKVGWHRADDE